MHAASGHLPGRLGFNTGHGARRGASLNNHADLPFTGPRYSADGGKGLIGLHLASQDQPKHDQHHTHQGEHGQRGASVHAGRRIWERLCVSLQHNTMLDDDEAEVVTKGLGGHIHASRLEVVRCHRPKHVRRIAHVAGEGHLRAHVAHQMGCRATVRVHRTVFGQRDQDDDVLAEVLQGFDRASNQDGCFTLGLHQAQGPVKCDEATVRRLAQGGFDGVVLEVGKDLSVHGNGRPLGDAEGIGAQACVVVREIRTGLICIQAPMEQADFACRCPSFQRFQHSVIALAMEPLDDRGVQLLGQWGFAGGRDRSKQNPEEEQRQRQRKALHSSSSVRGRSKRRRASMRPSTSSSIRVTLA